MGRHKKINIVKVEENKSEVDMTQATTEVKLEDLQTEIDIARKELESTKIQLEERRKELEASAKREISASEVKIIDKQVTMSSERKVLSDTLERQKKIDNEKVTGKFINRRAPGNSVKLTYLKYQDDPVKWYVFEDGKVYTIPRGFSDQINEYYHTPKFIQKEGEMDPNKPSSTIHDVDTSNKKYAFVPVSF